jgi:hypothetical protein
MRDDHEDRASTSGIPLPQSDKQGGSTWTRSTWNRVRGRSSGNITRRTALAALAGGVGAVVSAEMGLARRRKRRARGRVGAEAKPAANAGVRQRPLSDCLSAQGTTTEFVPPMRDVIAWAQPPAPNSVILPFAWVEYADAVQHRAVR